MEMEQYENVLKVVQKSGDWTLYTILMDIESLSDRVEKIKKVFQVACNKNDDKSALQYFSWFLKAVDDTNLVDFVEEDDDSEGLPYNDEVSKAKLGAQADRARITMELYNGLSTSRVGLAQEFIAEDETRSVNIDIPTLPKTKRAMLTEVAGWWKNTKNEKEADKIFDFLCQIPTRFEEEQKMRLDVIRKATSFGFPVPRLTRQFLSLAPRTASLCSEKSDIASVLAIARTRNKEEEELFQELMVMQYLQGCSEGAFQFLESTAKQLAIFDAEARELKEMMQPSRGFNYPVSGKIQISYLDIGSLTVSIKRIRPVYPPFESNSLEDKLYKEEFEVARKLILQWKKKYSKRNVKNVKLVFTIREEESLKLIFSMNRTF